MGRRVRAKLSWTWVAAFFHWRAMPPRATQLSRLEPGGRRPGKHHQGAATGNHIKTRPHNKSSANLRAPLKRWQCWMLQKHHGISVSFQDSWFLDRKHSRILCFRILPTGSYHAKFSESLVWGCFPLSSCLLYRQLSPPPSFLPSWNALKGSRSVFLQEFMSANIHNRLHFARYHTEFWRWM